MLRHQVFALALGLCVINGIFSPFTQLVAGLNVLWAPIWLPASASILFYLSSLIVATSALLLSGVPVAITERLAPGLRGSVAATWIWVAGAAILCFPAFIRILLLSGAFA